MGGRTAGRIMLFLAWMAGLFLAARFFADWEAREVNPNTDPVSRQTGSYMEVQLAANAQGHFLASGSLNGQPVVFLLDTGATNVAIPRQLGERLGLVPGAPVSVMTAGGVGRGYRTQVARLELGAIRLDNVSALLIPDFDSSVVLLGMSALQKLEFTQRDGTLVLRQYLD